MGIRLKLNGKHFEVNPPPPSVVKIKAILDKCPVDELFTTDELGKKAGHASDFLRTLSAREDLSLYVTVARSKKYWGNPKAIAELIKQVGS